LLDELATLTYQVTEIEQPSNVAAVVADQTAELLQTLIRNVAELKLEHQSRSEMNPRSHSRSKSHSRF